MHDTTYNKICNKNSQTINDKLTIDLIVLQKQHKNYKYIHVDNLNKT